MSRLTFGAAFGALVASIAAVASAQEPSAGDAAEGHRLALKICTACHVVAPDQPFPPTLRNPAPSFQALADKPGVTATSLHDFMLTTHTTIRTPLNMPNLSLTEDQAAALVAYILSLRSHH